MTNKIPEATEMDKKKEEYYQKFGNRFQDASNLPTNSFVKSIFGNEVWSWISTNFVPKEEVEKEKKFKLKLCPRCKGAGKIYSSYMANMPLENCTQYLCSNCNGTGKVERITR